MTYISGKVIKELREKRGYTQKQLAEILLVSDKTVSKWETDRGLPDISLITPLAKALCVSVAELLVGEYATNLNVACNMKKINFYICPVCHNIITSTGEGSFSCCGISLPVATIENTDEHHIIDCDNIENELFVYTNHPMEKDHYISFFAYVTCDRVEIVKLYPEQSAQCRFMKRGHGYIFGYCNKDGLFCVTI